MKDVTRSGLRILQIALAIGVLGDILLRQMPWGLNVFVFNAAFVVGVVILLRNFKPDLLNVTSMLLLSVQLFFAAMFVWRDAIELRVADTFAIVIVISLLVVPKLQTPTRLAGVFHYASAVFWSGVHVLFAPFALIFADVEWASSAGKGPQRHLFSAIRGLAIAAPLLLIFGGLFMAADAQYEGLVQRTFNIDAEVMFSHIVIFSLLSWATAGFLRGVLITSVGDMATNSGPISVTGADREDSSAAASEDSSDKGSASLPNDHSIIDHINISDPPNVDTEPGDTETASEVNGSWQWSDINNSVMPPAFTFGAIETGIILGLINLLFLSFVIVQIPYLFGGMEFIQNTPDLKLAEYARRGFGELVWVSALVLPLLLVSHWLIRRDDPMAGKLFKVLGSIQIALLFVIMASAVQRLTLLTGELGYGLTTVRLYPLIFMAWLAVVFLWFGMTVIRGARQYFAWGALWSAIVVLGATHVLDPDQFIVRTNLELMREGRDFDAKYNSELSDDALPVLFEGIAEMSPDDQQHVALALAKRYCTMRDEHDIRSFNLARWRASAFLDSADVFVQAIDCTKLPGVRLPDRDHDVLPRDD